MTNLRLLTTRRCLIAGVLMLASNLWAQQRSPLLEKVAKAFGVDSWNQIEAIRYTWNGEITGLFKLSRTWEWEPKTNKVTYEGKDKDGKPVKVTYVRSELGSQDDNVKNEIDPGFINDNYWLLFPFHAYWDTGVQHPGRLRFHLKDRGAESHQREIVSGSQPRWPRTDDRDSFPGRFGKVGVRKKLKQMAELLDIVTLPCFVLAL